MDTYDVKLIERPTGRVHNVTGHGVQPIVNEATGDPETEFALVAEIDGHYVDLGTFTAGHVQHQVERPDTAIDDASTSSSSSAQPTGDTQAAPAEQPESPTEGQSTAGEGAAQPQAPQPAG